MTVMVVMVMVVILIVMVMMMVFGAAAKGGGEGAGPLLCWQPAARSSICRDRKLLQLLDHITPHEGYSDLSPLPPPPQHPYIPTHTP